MDAGVADQVVVVKHENDRLRKLEARFCQRVGKLMDRRRLNGQAARDCLQRAGRLCFDRRRKAHEERANVVVLSVERVPRCPHLRRPPRITQGAQGANPHGDAGRLPIPGRRGHKREVVRQALVEEVHQRRAENQFSADLRNAEFCGYGTAHGHFGTNQDGFCSSLILPRDIVRQPGAGDGGRQDDGLHRAAGAVGGVLPNYDPESAVLQIETRA